MHVLPEQICSNLDIVANPDIFYNMRRGTIHEMRHESFSVTDDGMDIHRKCPNRRMEHQWWCQGSIAMHPVIVIQQTYTVNDVQVISVTTETGLTNKYSDYGAVYSVCFGDCS